MNRFDRVTAILIQLQSRRVVKALDIAERFNISLRTVYRDIRTLEEAGIPIIGEAGVGYSIMDGYKLPPVMFTREEALTFLTAEKLVEKFTDPTIRDTYQSAMYKIRSVLRGSEKEALDHIEDHIEVRRGNMPFNIHADNTLEVLLKGISESKVVKIVYQALDKNEPSERAIEPIGIYYEYNYWYTIAWCHLRKSYRNFRTDRIHHILLTDQIFERKHASLKEYLEQLPRNNNLEKIVVQIPQAMTVYVQEQKYYYGFVSQTEKGNMTEMTFLSASIEGFARWFLMMADRSVVVSPETLKDRVKELAEQIYTKYQ